MLVIKVGGVRGAITELTGSFINTEKQKVNSFLWDYGVRRFFN